MATNTLDTTAARTEILARIRKAAPAPAVPPTETWATVPRDYRRTASLDHEGIVALLEDRLRDYDADVVRIHPGQVAETVAHLLTKRGFTNMLVPAGIPLEWLPQSATFTEDGTDDPARMGAFDGVLTAATVAVAETGTLILQHGPGQGRRALTLVPDYHLCVLEEHQIVETVPEAMDRITATASLPTTFFSGPSATADIEMTRIKGVHGPRFLDIILIRTQG